MLLMEKSHTSDVFFTYRVYGTRFTPRDTVNGFIEENVTQFQRDFGYSYGYLKQVSEAESFVGVKKGDFESCAFWLSHNKILSETPDDTPVRIYRIKMIKVKVKNKHGRFV